MSMQDEQRNPDADWEASVSSWVDGESDVRAEELDTPYGRQLWNTYHLIGDVMRSDALAIQPSERFYARVSAALDAEPPIAAPLPLRGRRPWLRTSLSGLAMAAAVASVVWVARPMLVGDAPGGGEPAAIVAQADPAPPADERLSEYMEAHQTMAGAGPLRTVSFDGMGAR